MIKRNRAAISCPASLDPSSTIYIDEYSHNSGIVNSNIGKKWEKFSSSLTFNLYKKNSDVKAALSKLFGNNCAYCESNLNNQDLHTEHFRPKAEVDKFDLPSQEGYWWLAADWENMLPACIHCNRSPGIDHVTSTASTSGKGNRFPLLPGSSRAKIPGQEKSEKCALIDPTLDEPTSLISFKHVAHENLAYEVSTNNSTDEWLKANATISILGLNRPGLVRMRNKHLIIVKDYVDIYLSAAKKLNDLTQQKASNNELMAAKAAVDEAWNKIYSRFLSGDNIEYLSATIRCIEAELCLAKLSLKSLLGGRSLHIPNSNIT